MLKMVPSYYFISKKTGIIFGKRQKILIFMKNSRNQENKQSIQVQTNKPRPEIRDDMDSRSNKEGNKNSVGNSKKQGNTEPKK